METMAAFAMGRENRGKELMVFDWDKAARIITERGAAEAEAGLDQDWEYTGGPILKDGKPVPKEETYVYLASTWATPQLLIDGECIDCYRMESEVPGWGSDTYWPEIARDILAGRVIDAATTEPKRLGYSPADEPKWHIDGTLVYQLEHAGWRKGKELTQNRVTVHVQPFAGSSKAEAEALAQRIAEFLNAAA
jgi:hypothetical protein